MHFPNLLEEVSEQRVYPPVLYLAVLHQGPQHQQESQVEGNHQKSTRPIVVAGNLESDQRQWPILVHKALLVDQCRPYSTEAETVFQYPAVLGLEDRMAY